MNNDLKYPSLDAVTSVLQKIGVDPTTRDLNCQDVEYTSCLLAELPLYYELYIQQSTTEKEKRVLGCYILQCLEDHLNENGSEHLLQEEAVKTLYRDKHIHSTELDYWIKHGWTIAQYLENTY